MSIFRRKDVASLQAEVASDTSLKRVLGPVNLVLLGIGAVIGAGIFVLTGQAAANYAGPGIVFSFILAGTACAFAGLCYAEFAAMIPIAGSAYTYGYATLGELFAWIIGWDLILEYLFAASTVAVGWSGYVVSFLKDLAITIPEAYTSAPYVHTTPPDAGLNVWRLFTEGWSATGHVLNVPAMFIVAVITILLIVAISESATFNNIAVAIKVTVVLLFIAFGLAYINADNWTPFVPPAEGPGKYGWDGIVRGAGVIFFAYIGFDAVSTAAQECKNPQRDMPIGILGSLVICTVLYVLFSYVLSGVATVEDFRTQGREASVAFAISTYMTGYEWLSRLVTVAILAGFSSVILVMLLGQSRVFYSMSRDGLVPSVFSDIHPRFKTPWKANIIFFVLTAIFGAFVPGDVVGEMTSIGTLFAFMLVCAGVWIMRVRRPDIQRGFVVPALPLVAILGIVTCGAMIYGLGWTNWMRLAAWLAVGLVIYFGYSRSHSKLETGA